MRYNPLLEVLIANLIDLCEKFAVFIGGVIMSMYTNGDTLRNRLELLLEYKTEAERRWVDEGFSAQMEQARDRLKEFTTHYYHHRQEATRRQKEGRDGETGAEFEEIVSFKPKPALSAER